VISTPTTTTFTIPVDTTTAPAYTGGGTASPIGSGYFDGGMINFTSGAEAGNTFEIKSYMPGQFVLLLPMMGPLPNMGDNYTATPGCDKQLHTCATKFNNVPNHRGFPYVPGNDKIIKMGSFVTAAGASGGKK
jgi:uncharacterized phage protein (TIGR02218 family)